MPVYIVFLYITYRYRMPDQEIRNPNNNNNILRVSIETAL